MTPRPYMKVIVDPGDPRWRDRANCLGVDPDLFFPATGDVDVAREARAVCAGCTVRRLCLDYALANREKHGVWGGRTYRERLRILRHRTEAARRPA